MFAQEEQTPRPHSSILPRRKGPPAALRIDTPAQNAAIALAVGDSSAASTLSSANSDSDNLPPFEQPKKPRAMKNTKRLSLALPSAQSDQSSNSLALSSSDVDPAPSEDSSRFGTAPDKRRRPSIVSLPSSSVAGRLLRKDEDDSPSAPYVDGPIQVVPGVWLGSEDNARDWNGLRDRGIRSILNVAREVNSPFDSAASSQPLRQFVSTPDLKDRMDREGGAYYPTHAPSGRPAMHYLKLPWSHGQSDLVHDGFVSAMTFIDAALDRGDGVLVHCQCGVSRSATVVIALVMRAAALMLPSVPPDVWALKGSGMQGAYDYVKKRSSWVGPNMQLIYQLLDYEQTLYNKSPSASEKSSNLTEEEEEWNRRRQLLDDDSESADADRESQEVMREARALDKAMEERIVARKASGSSMGSSNGIGMGSAWKSRYGSRARTGSIASILTEDLVEESEEQELLGVGGSFDCPSVSFRSYSGETTEEEQNVSSPDARKSSSFRTGASPPSGSKPYAIAEHSASSERVQPPPSAPASKTSFGFASRLSFKRRGKQGKPPLDLLPTVPSSPIIPAALEIVARAPVIVEPRKRIPPPLRLNSMPNTHTHTRSSSRSSQATLNTPSQTLFVFPPSPTLKATTPLTVTVTSSLNVPAPFFSVPTPRVSTFKLDGGRRRSFIGVTTPPTPTTACSRVDARGWIAYGP